MNRNYNYEKFDNAHAKAIAGISRAMGCDLGVARDMLIDMATKGDPTIYKGLPEGYDLAACKKDVVELHAQHK